MPTVHAIIVGQGFAGTALAWSLAMRGTDFIVIDSGLPNTSSRIAAGLVTPITGPRAVKSWAWEDAWRAAQRFYLDIESRTKTRFWSIQPSLRLYDSEAERAVIEARLPNHPSELVAAYSPLDQASDARCFDQSLGGFVMKTAARLDAQVYLTVSRDSFQRLSAFRHYTLDLPSDIECRGETIRIPELDIEARIIIFCQGYDPETNPWFSRLPMVPAQGDILTLKIPNFIEKRTIHRGIWLTPASQNTTDVPPSHYNVGSTYRWQPLDGLPSLEGREEILSKLKRWWKLPFEVVDHRSAVRPTSFDHRPLLGQSSFDPRFWVFNGLGAKGALLAPWCANHLVACLMEESSVNQAIHWDRRRS